MKKIITLTAGAILLSATSVLALPYGGDATSLQNIMNNITLATPSNPSGNSSVNANTDYLGFDTTWQINGVGGSVATLVIELAGYAPYNTFGIYQGNNKFDIFGGAAVQGYQATVSIGANGSVSSLIKDENQGFVAYTQTAANFFNGNYFGYFLTSPYSTFYSDDTKNADGMDHMLAYAGKGDLIEIAPYAPGPWSQKEYILAFEDLVGGGDRDYDDFVVMVSSVTPVPEPGTIVLLGAGLLGLGLYGRRRAKK